MAATVWIDARAGVAGDMLLGALVDAGADLDAVRAHVEAVMPGTVTLRAESVTRTVMRATRLHVEAQLQDHPHRAWRDIRGMLTDAELPERVRRDALAAFAALAVAEGRVHGIDPEDVHFHEVGAWDSIADVVGVCSALAALGAARVLTSDIGLGDGVVRGAHGVLPVPVPAVLRLLEGAVIGGRGVPASTSSPVGELATPTGVALLVALAESAPTMPAGRVVATGVGAGAKNGLPWANVVRAVVLQEPEVVPEPATLTLPDVRDLLVLETNVDDLDPRVWPSVLADLMEAGALDAWLTPIVMKKGRPAHLLSALVAPEDADRVRDRLFRSTSTLGVRETPVRRRALARDWVSVEATLGDVSARVRVKVGHADGEIVVVTPEFEDARAAAVEAGVPVREALAAAASAAQVAGLVPGARLRD